MITKVDSKMITFSSKCETQMKSLKEITDEVLKRVTNAKENAKKST
jgi:hypothetical protein